MCVKAHCVHWTMRFPIVPCAIWIGYSHNSHLDNECIIIDLTICTYWTNSFVLCVYIHNSQSVYKGTIYHNYPVEFWLFGKISRLNLHPQCKLRVQSVCHWLVARALLGLWSGGPAIITSWNPSALPVRTGCILSKSNWSHSYANISPPKYELSRKFSVWGILKPPCSHAK